MQNNYNTLRIGLVGCGRWGRWILRDLKQLGAIVHVVASSPQSIENAKTYNADQIVSSINELNFNLDGYVIASITTAHFDNIQFLKERGKPIYVEKPLSIHLEDVEKLNTNSSNQVFVMHKWRYHPGVIKIREIIDSNTYGKVLSIHCRRNQWGLPHKDVNTVWIHMPHDLSIIHHLLGFIPSLTFSQLIKDDSGKINGIYSVLGDRVVTTIEHNIFSIYKERDLKVYFEKCVIHMNDPLADHLVLRKGKPRGESSIVKIPISTEWPLLRELRAFLDYVGGTSESLYSTLDTEVRIVEAITGMLNFKV